MKRAYVVPHPPIILPEVGRGEERNIQDTIDAYEQISKEIALIKPETIILSSPHAPYFSDAFYMADAANAHGDLTAFGVMGVEEDVKMDSELAKEILSQGKDLPIHFSKVNADELDHGTLVPLRMIRKHYSDFKLVRLGISTMSGTKHYKMGMAISKAFEKLGRNVVYIASGDLSHALKDRGPYGYHKDGPAFDKKIVDILERASFDELINISCFDVEDAAQCGLGSFQMMAGFLDGYDVEAKKLSYEGPFGVGYAVISFTGKDKNEKRHFIKSDELDPYIELARKTIDTFIRDNVEISPPDDLPKAMLEERAGCFVSIHRHGELRGCIGTIGPTKDNIAEEIIENAVSASTRDLRFPAITVEELSDLDISVDILEKAEPVTSMDELDASIYGVIVTSGFRRGLLLPNLEGVNTPEEQIAIALKKARIHPEEEFELERFKVIRHEYK